MLLALALLASTAPSVLSSSSNAPAVRIDLGNVLAMTNGVKEDFCRLVADLHMRVKEPLFQCLGGRSQSKCHGMNETGIGILMPYRSIVKGTKLYQVIVEKLGTDKLTSPVHLNGMLKLKVSYQEVSEWIKQKKHDLLKEKIMNSASVNPLAALAILRKLKEAEADYPIDEMVKYIQFAESNLQPPTCDLKYNCDLIDFGGDRFASLVRDVHPNVLERLIELLMKDSMVLEAHLQAQERDQKLYRLVGLIRSLHDLFSTEILELQEKKIEDSTSNQFLLKLEEVFKAVDNTKAVYDYFQREVGYYCTLSEAMVDKPYAGMCDVRLGRLLEAWLEWPGKGFEIRYNGDMPFKGDIQVGTDYAKKSLQITEMNVAEQASYLSRLIHMFQVIDPLITHKLKYCLNHLKENFPHVALSQPDYVPKQNNDSIAPARAPVQAPPAPIPTAVPFIPPMQPQTKTKVAAQQVTQPNPVDVAKWKFNDLTKGVDSNVRERIREMLDGKRNRFKRPRDVGLIIALKSCGIELEEQSHREKLKQLFEKADRYSKPAFDFFQLTLAFDLFRTPKFTDQEVCTLQGFLEWKGKGYMRMYNEYCRSGKTIYKKLKFDQAAKSLLERAKGSEMLQEYPLVKWKLGQELEYVNHKLQ